MVEAGHEDLLPEWRCVGRGSRPNTLGPSVGWMTGLFGGMGAFFLFMPSRLGVFIFLGWLAFGLGLGVFFHLCDRRSWVELWVENGDAGMTLMLRRWGGGVRRVPLTQVRAVRVTRNTAEGPPVLGIIVRVGRRRYRAGRGPNADALVSALRAGGVNVITRDRALADSDGPDIG